MSINLDIIFIHMWGYHLNIGGGGYRHQADK